MNSIVKKLIFLIIFLGLVLWVGYYHLGLIFSESLAIEKNTYPYYLLIPEAVRTMPLFKPSSPPHYFSSAGDGNKPASIAVSYETLAPEKAILDFYNHYFLSLDYSNMSGDSYWGQLAFEDDSGTFFIKVAHAHEGARTLNSVFIRLIN